MERIICIAPVFDEVTEITFEESRGVVQYAKQHNVEVIDLVKEDAVREKVEETLKHYSGLVYHADHGNEKSWIGNDEQPCIDLKNVELLKGKDAYANNCSSAKKLGVEAWKRGATYWGYTEVFTFTTDALEEFREFVNFGLKRRIDGFSWRECLEKTKKRATELIDKLVETGRTLAASCMVWDKNHLVCYNAEPPTTTCKLRVALLKIFGPLAGWRLSKKTALGWLLSLIGWGVTVHAVANELYCKGGYAEILKPQGEWIGLGLNLIGIMLLISEHVRQLISEPGEQENQSV